MSAEARVAELGLELPEAPAPGGNYTPMVQVGDICYVSGHGPLKTDGEMLKGRVGSEVSEEDGYVAARQVGLAMLATLRANLGSLDRVKRVVKVLGMVNAAPDFETHPKVMNGFSDLMVEVFGDPGRAARSAIGMGSLPGNISVEVEAIVHRLNQLQSPVTRLPDQISGLDKVVHMKTGRVGRSVPELRLNLAKRR